MKTFKISAQNGTCPYYSSRLILEHDKGNQFNLWLEAERDRPRKADTTVTTVTPAFLRKLADMLEEGEAVVVKSIPLA